MKSAGLGIGRYLREVMACRLCRNVAFLVLTSILIIEGAILVPSYRNYERDLLLRLEHVGQAIVSASLRGQGHQGKREVLLAARLMLAAPQIVGGAVYGGDGVAIGTFGEAPKLPPRGGAARLRSEDGRRYAVVYTGKALNLPVDVVANLNSSWIAGELEAFLRRIVGLVLLITSFVTLATMAVIGHFVLSPLLYLRDHLNAAAADPENPRTITIGGERQNELGEVMQQFDALLHKVSTAHHSARERLAAMVDNSANAVFAVEPDGRLIYANRAGISLSKVAEIEQLDHLSLPLIIKTDGTEIPLARYLLEAEDTGEVELQDAGGARITCMLRVNRLAGRDGRVSLHYAWAIDITERRRSEEALRRAMEESKIANHAKTEFLANMSHELRTPLNAIIGFSEIVRDEIFGPLGHAQYGDYVRDIHGSGLHLLAIINDILDLSRIEAGMTALSESEVDLQALIEDSVRIAQGRMDSGQTRITTHMTTELPPVLCDNRLLKQVLLNVLSNALNFTPDHGEVTSPSALTRATAPGLKSPTPASASRQRALTISCNPSRSWRGVMYAATTVRALACRLPSSSWNCMAAPLFWTVLKARVPS
ncbi:MAG: histidine kinase dimerization/phospho-acceptor domain-containing protein, partial [Alphaproteobacteria bacterium]|nr:histidine kinase dimerization/phospho-acceptor domain-containing protein [Alphaproteobacteria bacterium]